jgi:membrane protease YdiL (CAAX protease family)
MILGSLALLLAGSLVLFLSLRSGAAEALPAGPGLRQLAALAAGGGVVLLGMLVGVAGLALYVLIPAFSGPERAARDRGSHRVVVASTLLAALAGNVIAAVYLIPASVSRPSPGTSGELDGLLSPVGIAVSALALDLALLAVVYLRIVRPGAITWARMGLQRENLAGRLFMGVPLGLLLLAVSAGLGALLETLGIRQTQPEVFASVRGASVPEFALVFLAGAVVAPIVEEVYFRGFVFRGYLEQKGVLRAFAYSAGLFALVHLNLPALLPILAMGLLLALVYYRSGSIVPGIVAHSINNAAAFFLLYLGAQ